MKQNEIIRLAVACVLVAVVAFAVYKMNTGSFKSGANQESLFSDFPVNDVTRFTVQAPENESVTLVKTNEVWAVEDRGAYAADFSKVAEFLRSVAELRPLTKEEVGDSQLARVELQAPDAGEGAGTDIVFEGEGGAALASVRLGKEIERQSSGTTPSFGSAGRFVKRLGDNAQVFTVDDVFSSVVPDPSQWLDKETFFKVKGPRRVALTSSEESENWVLSRAVEGGDWSLETMPSGKVMDSSKTTVFNSFMSFPSFVDVATDASLMDDPRTLVIETFEGFTYTIQVGAETDGKYAMTVAVAADIPQERSDIPEEETEEAKAAADKAFEDEKQALEEKLAEESKLEGNIYLVNNWTVDNGLKSGEDFVKDPEPEESGDDLGAGSLPPLLEAPDVGALVEDAVESTIGSGDQ